ncbi:hypothetical protein ACIBQ1_23130 [Nonomuraea sp. NPDC050153]|uniref:hypothetical protein n=1 Tax=Nonomuraea sp. NPDC050153 TaxID=3364359 RepID=UPI0037B7B944
MIYVLRSELGKMSSIASTYWNAFAAVLVSVALGAMGAASMLVAWEEASLADRARIESTFTPASYSLLGIGFGLCAVLVFSVLTITSEYGTGQIRSTLAAVPNRAVLLTSKALTVFLAGTVTGLVMGVAGFVVGQLVLSTHDLETTITAPGVLVGLVRGAVAVGLAGVAAFAVGSLVRNTPAAIMVVLAIFYLPMFLVPMLPDQVGDKLDYLPSMLTIGAAAPQSEVRPDTVVGPLPSLGLMVAWAVVPLAIAMVVNQRRDA